MDFQDTPDADLLRAYARSGSEGAFTELMRRYLGIVLNVAARKMGGDREAARDVAQRVFVLAAQKAPALAMHPLPAAWLHETTRLVASEFLRAEMRRTAREREAFTMDQLEAGGNGEAADWSRIGPAVDDELAHLDEPNREAVLLRFFAGLSHAQVGARLAISENAARMRVERALDRLRAGLVRRGIQSTAGAIALTLTNEAGAAWGAVAPELAPAMAKSALGAVGTVELAGKSAVGLKILAQQATIPVAAVVALGIGYAFFHRSNPAPVAPVVVAAPPSAKTAKPSPVNPPPFIAPPRQVVSAPPAPAEDPKVAQTRRLLELKPLLAAGLPITGTIVTKAKGKAVSHPMKLVMGEEAWLDDPASGFSWEILPTLNSDGTVRFDVAVFDLAQGANQKPGDALLSMPAIITQPWLEASIMVADSEITFQPDPELGR